ncbi:helix-turn-helix domain-containing protein [Salmonella enterica subsp. enterica]|uniref:Helix-turn-helix domain-containing protein n=1 Tax=Salmonella enterica TaxID=28901 RepID=A0A633DB15_SALER|nr:hypothetical protein [Salmonella enterica]EBW2603669.1 hypothetical protein [Salmonella enterica subsp. enterica serovar Poano]EBE9327980.1 hypothetical protein [Salmonella enterica]ECC0573628.1 helix-turn-helix domain-containing protein [Salmonella enterica]ECD2094035.1 hypothetical protein [Salmonella enterica subsp. enterica serovar Poano]
MAKPAGKSPSAARTARILKVLSGRTNTGMTAGEIADAAGIPATRISELLDALQEEDLIIEVCTPEGSNTQRYAHSMEMLQIAYKCIREDKLIQQRLEQKQKTLIAGAGK